MPGKTYPAISITGKGCSLMCDYCKAHYLGGMLCASSPNKLYKLSKKLWEEGAKGILISGGFNFKGELPIEPFLPTIKRIKKDFNLVISVHPGVVSRKLAGALGDAGIDVVDYEFLIDPLVIKDIMHLRKTKEDFINGLKWLIEEGPPYVAPHIPIGFHYGKINMEKEALGQILDFNPYVLIFVIFTPTKGTPMESIHPPPVKEIVELFRFARKGYKGNLALGCMRPPEYRQRLDDVIIKQKLVDRIAVPRWQIMERHGLKKVSACCSLPEEFLQIFD
ncbi:MAG TPA: radical SAM protein [Candidatus Korarchaeota archaeon]|nr:radical SAM protein [Candidatus Korarchaeota archaeon]